MSGRKNKFSVDDKIRIIIPLLREDREPSLLARIARGSGVSAMTLVTVKFSILPPQAVSKVL